jgi:cobalt/nickel transport system permease protein
MHIPDGYLGPPTYLASFAACAPLWGVAARKVKTTSAAKRAPLLAIAAAFSFVVMMFNVPLPGATTGHAVGGVLIAVAVGPWGATLAISIALIVQALLFGDGGITAIGANCLNIAFVMPFVGYAVYRWLSGHLSSRKGRAVAAAIGAWLGLTAAAFTTSYRASSRCSTRKRRSGPVRALPAVRDGPRHGAGASSAVRRRRGAAHGPGRLPSAGSGRLGCFNAG